MKRNSIFMWAYISFIIFSVLLRIFVEFSLWRPIVLAITVSSVFFALEDLYASLYHSLKDSLDISNDFASEARKKYEKEMKILTKIDESVPLYKDSQYDITDINCIYEPARKGYLEIDEIICSVERDNEAKRNKLNKYRKATYCLAYFGFLCLFCTLIIVSSITVPEVVQEVLTVVPFAMILITQQLKSISAEKNRKDLIGSKHALETQALASELLAESEKKFDYLLSLISVLEEKEEEARHAD